MKLTILLALAFALHAEDAQPLATVEQLQKQVAERDNTIAGLQAQVNYWAALAVVCDAQPRIRQLNAQVDAQAKAQIKQRAADDKSVGNTANPK